MEILKKKVGKWERVRLTETVNGNFKVWSSHKLWFADDYHRAVKHYKRIAREIHG